METKPTYKTNPPSPQAMNLTDLWANPQLQALIRLVAIAILEQILAALKKTE